MRLYAIIKQIHSWHKKSPNLFYYSKIYTKIIKLKNKTKKFVVKCHTKRYDMPQNLFAK